MFLLVIPKENGLVKSYGGMHESSGSSLNCACHCYGRKACFTDSESFWNGWISFCMLALTTEYLIHVLKCIKNFIMTLRSSIVILGYVGVYIH